MTERIRLQAEKREEIGTKSAQSLRVAGYLPAVIYGREFNPVNLKVDYKGFAEAYKQAGSSTMIDLRVNDESYPAIIQEVSVSPISGDYLHADFYKVRLDQKITAHIPLNFVGESPAIRDLNGILNRTVSEVEVYALPQDLPPHIDVDISVLTELGQSILIKDLKIPSNIDLRAGSDEIVATAVRPEEEVEKVAEISVEDVEIISKEKEEIPAEEEASKEKEE